LRPNSLRDKLKKSLGGIVTLLADCFPLIFLIAAISLAYSAKLNLSSVAEISFISDVKVYH
jgi:hypothetical protein